jgi:hypothetical protein
MLTRNPRLKHFVVVLAAVLTLGAVTLKPTPSEARVFVGVGVPLPGFGYYAPAPYYPYGYYGYPAYAYPGGVFIGGTFGPHHHHYFHHHWR